MQKRKLGKSKCRPSGSAVGNELSLRPPGDTREMADLLHTAVDRGLTLPARSVDCSRHGFCVPWRCGDAPSATLTTTLLAANSLSIFHKGLDRSAEICIMIKHGANLLHTASRRDDRDSLDDSSPLAFCW